MNEKMAKVAPPKMYYWVTIGDSRVCPDCVGRGSMEPKEIEEWVSIGLPREGATLCGDNCRCILDSVPDPTDLELEVELDDTIDEIIDRLMAGIKFDKLSGRSIMLQDFKTFTGIKELDLGQASKFDALLEEMFRLIARWKGKDGRTLPKSFYELDRVTDMIKWLRGQLK